MDPTIDRLTEFVVGENLDYLDVAEAIRVVAVDGEGNNARVWRLRDCLSGEVTLDQQCYQLDEATLYLVDDDSLLELDRYVSDIPAVPEPLEKSTVGMHEAAYNAALASSLEGILLDRRNVVRPGATAVELCDVATKGRVAIHAKRGTSSSSLSHLFAQGVISATLLLMDKEFRSAAAGGVRANEGCRSPTETLSVAV